MVETKTFFRPHKKEKINYWSAIKSLFFPFYFKEGSSTLILRLLVSLLASDLLQHGSLLFSLFAFYDGLHKTTLIHGKFECTCFQISINLQIFGEIADIFGLWCQMHFWRCAIQFWPWLDKVFLMKKVLA